jgi:hypothetical protein
MRMTTTSTIRRRDIVATVWLVAATAALVGCRTKTDATVAALLGRWRIVGYDGAPVNSSGAPGTDPNQPTTYMAGSSIDFTRDRFRLNRGAATVVDRPISLLARRGPSEIGINIGYGESKIELLGARRARLHVATIPAHVVLMERAQ